jgi:hypothetical protein
VVRGRLVGLEDGGGEDVRSMTCFRLTGVVMGDGFGCGSGGGFVSLLLRRGVIMGRGREEQVRWGFGVEGLWQGGSRNVTEVKDDLFFRLF